MPPRTICSVDECDKALEISLLQWTGESDVDRRRDQFLQKVKDQVCEVVVSAADADTTNIKAQELVPLDENLANAILFVLKTSLEQYTVEKYYLLNLKSYSLSDKLESVGLDKEKTKHILQWAPFYLDQTEALPRKKFAFHCIDDIALLDPFNRFRAQNDCLRDMDAALLAYHQYTETSGNIEGNSFEAIVASHAINSSTVSCFCCKRLDSLVWSGGMLASFRDLFCTNCHSCFEIKSKRNKEVIENIFKHRELLGGSFRRWCKETFPTRNKGKDYIVVVGREARLELSEVAWTSGKRHWLVEIAEIESVFPVLCPMSFVEADEDDISVKTRIRVDPTTRRVWFKVPHEQIDLQSLFRESFAEVFPTELGRVANTPLSAHQSPFPKGSDQTQQRSPFPKRRDQTQQQKEFQAMQRSMESLSLSGKSNGARRPPRFSRFTGTSQLTGSSHLPAQYGPTASHWIDPDVDAPNDRPDFVEKKYERHISQYDQYENTVQRRRKR